MAVAGIDPEYFVFPQCFLFNRWEKARSFYLSSDLVRRIIPERHEPLIAYVVKRDLFERQILQRFLVKQRTRMFPSRINRCFDVGTHECFSWLLDAANDGI